MVDTPPHPIKIDAKIGAAHEALGLALLPHQREWVRAVLAGERIVVNKGRKAGWTTAHRVALQDLSPGKVGSDDL